MRATWGLRACILLLPPALVACSAGGASAPVGAPAPSVPAVAGASSADEAPATEQSDSQGSCESTGAACAVGDIGAGGGVVFYVSGEPFDCLDGKQCTVLQAAPAGWYGTDADPEVPWCQVDQPGYAMPLDLDPAIGAGWLNTVTINEECGPESAAGLALAYRGAGLDDWYLPSVDELTALYQARSMVGGMDDDPLSYYWASGQDPSLDAVNAAVKFFDDEGMPGATFKDLTGRLRPIRAF